MKKSVLIFSLLDWESKLLHRSHMLAKYFSKKGFEVYYIQKENIRSLNGLTFKPKFYRDGKVTIISLPAFPYLKGKISGIYHLNDWIIGKQLKEVFSLIKNPLMVLESPYWIRAINKSRNKEGILCYDISDDLSQFATNEKWKSQLLNYEEETVEHSDYIFITAENLRSKGKGKKEIHLVENGVDLDEFSHGQNILRDKFEGPICGFIGGIFEWIDFDLIDKIGKQYPNNNFVLVGPTDRYHEVEKLCENKNIHYLGEKDKSEIGNYFASLDIGLIPFLSEERYPRLKTVNSNKIFQYCYFGYPIISTNFQQVRELRNIIEVCDDQNEFANRLGVLLAEDHMILQNNRKNYAMENSWERRVEEMIAIISEDEKNFY